MEKKDDFYIGYAEDISPNIKKTIRNFAVAALGVLVVSAIVFAMTQNKFKNSSFELASSTKVTGVYHEMPYPMLKVRTSESSFKNIVLLGFGKSSANPFLERIKSEATVLSGTTLSIEGNLIYYNGKTLLQITDDQEISILKKADPSQLPKTGVLVANLELKGEIIDPKCYFGVMKPGKGKIHRSCAVRCISGGVPPVLATNDNNNISEYYLITDKAGNPVHEAILPFVGKPSLVTGTVIQMEDWYQLRIDVSTIKDLNRPSKIY